MIQVHLFYLFSHVSQKMICQSFGILLLDQILTPKKFRKANLLKNMPYPTDPTAISMTIVQIAVASSFRKNISSISMPYDQSSTYHTLPPNYSKAIINDLPITELSVQYCLEY
jgi:hypothetical protein